MTDKVTSMETIAREVCGREGHGITNYTNGSSLRCSKCGMTVEEIRGEKAKTAFA